MTTSFGSAPHRARLQSSPTFTCRCRTAGSNAGGQGGQLLGLSLDKRPRRANAGRRIWQLQLLRADGGAQGAAAERPCFPPGAAAGACPRPAPPAELATADGDAENDQNTGSLLHPARRAAPEAADPERTVVPTMEAVETADQEPTAARSQEAADPAPTAARSQEAVGLAPTAARVQEAVGLAPTAARIQEAVDPPTAVCIQEAADLAETSGRAAADAGRKAACQKAADRHATSLGMRQNDHLHSAQLLV